MIAYCIDELRWKSKAFKKRGFVTAYDGDVVKSDTIIPDALKLELRAAAAPLEKIPVAKRDWHPGSNKTVLNLVHPSLYPVVYGMTRILKDSLLNLDDCVDRCGEGDTLPVPPKGSADVPAEQRRRWGRNIIQDPFSRKFQWMPCDVEFDEENKVK